MNEASTWNFSGLTTADPEAAIAFYGSVFGWEADLSDEGYTFFRVPGYGDVLEKRNPGWLQGPGRAGCPSRL